MRTSDEVLVVRADHEKEIAYLHYSKLNTSIGHGGPLPFPVEALDLKAPYLGRVSSGLEASWCL